MTPSSTPEADEIVDATHPLWTAWDDNDWNGETASNWMHSHIRPGIRVRLVAPKKSAPQLIEQIADSMRRMGATVEIRQL